MPHPTNQPTTITQSIQSTRTRELMLYNRKNTAALFHRGDTSTCDYHPKTKIPTLCCITDKNKKTTYKPAASTLAQQISYETSACVRGGGGIVESALTMHASIYWLQPGKWGREGFLKCKSQICSGHKNMEALQK
jgi:hypothetical protein